MKLSIRSRKFSDLETGLILLMMSGAGLVIGRFIPGVLDHLPKCLFRTWTTLPCPSCGATHAGLALCHAHPMDALRLNPLFTVLYISIALAGLNALMGMIFHRNLAVEWPRSGFFAPVRLLLGGIVLNWFYLLAVRFGLW
jgi:hypothetical protein